MIPFIEIRKFKYELFIKFITNIKIITARIVKKIFIESKNISFAYLNRSNSFLKSETLFNLNNLYNFL